MNEIEAISVLETRIKYPNSDTYGGMCEAEYQQEAVALAIEALREKQERENPAARVKMIVPEGPTSLFEYECGSCKSYLFASDKFCPMCGRRLEVEHE